MKKKYITAAFLGLLMLGAPVQMNAVSVDNSYYEQYQKAIGLIEKCSVRCSSSAKGVLEITAKTQVSGKMNEVGFRNIVVQRSSDGRNWQDEVTVGDKTAKNTKYYNLDGYTVNVQGGYYYRAVCVHYANGALRGKSETYTQTAENISSEVWVEAKPVTTTPTTTTTTRITTTKLTTTTTRLTTTTKVTTTLKATDAGINGNTTKNTTSAPSTTVKRATETKSAAYAQTTTSTSTNAASATKTVGAESTPNTGDKPPVLMFTALCSAGAVALFLHNKRPKRS